MSGDGSGVGRASRPDSLVKEPGASTLSLPTNCDSMPPASERASPGVAAREATLPSVEAAVPAAASVGFSKSSTAPPPSSSPPPTNDNSDNQAPLPSQSLAAVKPHATASSPSGGASSVLSGAQPWNESAESVRALQLLVSDVLAVLTLLRPVGSGALPQSIAKAVARARREAKGAVRGAAREKVLSALAAAASTAAAALEQRNPQYAYHQFRVLSASRLSDLQPYVTDYMRELLKILDAKRPVIRLLQAQARKVDAGEEVALGEEADAESETLRLLLQLVLAYCPSALLDSICDRLAAAYREDLLGGAGSEMLAAEGLVATTKRRSLFLREAPQSDALSSKGKPNLTEEAAAEAAAAEAGLSSAPLSPQQRHSPPPSEGRRRLPSENPEAAEAALQSSDQISLSLEDARTGERVASGTANSETAASPTEAAASSALLLGRVAQLLEQRSFLRRLAAVVDWQSLSGGGAINAFANGGATAAASQWDCVDAVGRAAAPAAARCAGGLLCAGGCSRGSFSFRAKPPRPPSQQQCLEEEWPRRRREPNDECAAREGGRGASAECLDTVPPFLWGHRGGAGADPAAALSERQHACSRQRLSKTCSSSEARRGFSPCESARRALLTERRSLSTAAQAICTPATTAACPSEQSPLSGDFSCWENSGERRAAGTPSRENALAAASLPSGVQQQLDLAAAPPVLLSSGRSSCCLLSPLQRSAVYSAGGGGASTGGGSRRRGGGGFRRLGSSGLSSEGFEGDGDSAASDSCAPSRLLLQTLGSLELPPLVVGDAAEGGAAHSQQTEAKQPHSLLPTTNLEAAAAAASDCAASQLARRQSPQQQGASLLHRKNDPVDGGAASDAGAGASAEETEATHQQPQSGLLFSRRALLSPVDAAATGGGRHRASPEEEAVVEEASSAALGKALRGGEAASGLGGGGAEEEQQPQGLSASGLAKKPSLESLLSHAERGVAATASSRNQDATSAPASSASASEAAASAAAGVSRSSAVGGGGNRAPNGSSRLDGEDKRVELFSLLLSWLPESSRVSLPPSGAAGAVKREAESALAQHPQQQPHPQAQSRVQQQQTATASFPSQQRAAAAALACCPRTPAQTLLSFSSTAETASTAARGENLLLRRDPRCASAGAASAVQLGSSCNANSGGTAAPSTFVSLSGEGDSLPPQPSAFAKRRRPFEASPTETSPLFPSLLGAGAAEGPAAAGGFGGAGGKPLDALDLCAAAAAMRERPSNCEAALLKEAAASADTDFFASLASGAAGDACCPAASLKAATATGTAGGSSPRISTPAELAAALRLAASSALDLESLSAAAQHPLPLHQPHHHLQQQPHHHLQHLHRAAGASAGGGASHLETAADASSCDFEANFAGTASARAAARVSPLASLSVGGAFGSAGNTAEDLGATAAGDPHLLYRSSVSGVVYDKSGQKWTARWSEYGRQHKKTFATAKYGFLHAKKRAEECRLEASRLMREGQGRALEAAARYAQVHHQHHQQQPHHHQPPQQQPQQQQQPLSLQAPQSQQPQAQQPQSGKRVHNGEGSEAAAAGDGGLRGGTAELAGGGPIGCGASAASAVGGGVKVGGGLEEEAAAGAGAAVLSAGGGGSSSESCAPGRGPSGTKRRRHKAAAAVYAEATV